MAGRACHVAGSTARLGLTEVLGCGESMLTRLQAKKIAECLIAKDEQFSGVGSVLAFEEISQKKPIAGYSGADLSQCWIAYLNRLVSLSLCESWIIAIDKETGNAVYFGGAGDEG